MGGTLAHCWVDLEELFYQAVVGVVQAYKNGVKNPGLWFICSQPTYSPSGDLMSLWQTEPSLSPEAGLPGAPSLTF